MRLVGCIEGAYKTPLQGTCRGPTGGSKESPGQAPELGAPYRRYRYISTRCQLDFHRLAPRGISFEALHWILVQEQSFSVTTSGVERGWAKRLRTIKITAEQDWERLRECDLEDRDRPQRHGEGRSHQPGARPLGTASWTPPQATIQAPCPRRSFSEADVRQGSRNDLVGEAPHKRHKRRGAIGLLIF